MMDIKRVLLQWFMIFLVKMLLVVVLKIIIFQTKKLAKEVHKAITRKFQKRKVYSPIIDNTWGVDLVNMQLLGKFNKEIHFLSSVIDIFSKYPQLIPLKDKRDITITSVFQNILDASNRKPNKIWVDKGSEFYNRSMKTWLEKLQKNVCST